MSKKQRYRIRNWSNYNTSLIKRGSITFWFDQKSLDQWSAPHSSNKRGRPQLYSDIAMQCLLMIKATFSLTFRALQGFAESLVILMGLKISIPSYTQMCRRQKDLSVSTNPLPRDKSLHVVIDSTGLKVYGEGEWKTRQHGYNKRRTWRKLHLAINPETHEIVAHQLTLNSTCDHEVLPDLLGQISDAITSIGADGAYDRAMCYQAAKDRQAKACIPPRKDAVLHQHGNCKKPPLMRDETLRSIRKLGRKGWKKASGYHQRSLAETAMFRFKTLLGDRLVNRLLEHQITEASIKCCVMNKMTSLGMPITKLVKVS